MKKFLCLICCLMFMFCSACANNKGWSTVDLENSGTIKIPNEWSIIHKDQLYYIFDSQHKPIMIQWPESDNVASNEYYNKYAVNSLLSSAVFSNGAMYGEYSVEYEMKTLNLLFLQFPNQNIQEDGITFLVWSKEVNIDTIKHVAETFISN